MSQAGAINVTGGGGGGDITFITDTGTTTGTEFGLQGQQYKDVPVMEVTNQLTDMFVANNSWQTPYVVDISTVDGEKGTFATIQDAIDSAFANSDASGGKFATIILRNAAIGTYQESLIFPDGNFHIKSLIPANIKNTLINFLSGTHTVPESSVVIFENLGLIPELTGTFLNSGKVIIYNCFWQSANDNVTPSAIFYAYDSNIIALELTSGTFEAYGCNISSSGSLSNVSFVMKDCDLLVGADFELNGVATGFFINCNNLALTGDTTGNISLDSVTIYHTVDLVNANILYNNIGFSPTGSGTEIFSTIFTSLFKRPTESGNVWKRRVSDVEVDYIVTIDQYIGVITANNSSLTFVDSGFVKEQVWYVFDESGTASTNPRTIIADSPRTINGQPNLIIDQDFGWAIITFDGDNYFAFTPNPSAAPANGYVTSWEVATTATPVSMQINTGYINESGGNVTYTLPLTSPTGAIIRITQSSATGDWTIAQNAGQSIHYLGSPTTSGTGGSISSSLEGTSLELVCTIADTKWVAISDVSSNSFVIV